MKSIPVSPWLAGLCFAFALASSASGAADAAPQGPAAFYVANWNVENLYDVVDDPDNDGDDEFLPQNPVTRWTRERYETKLDNLAQVISGMNKGQGPDVLGLEEIENEDVIRDLVDKLEGKSYGIVHVDSPDPRGIDTAMIFNRDHFSLLESHAYKVSLKWNHTTRDILHAVLEDHDGQKLHVFVNHWPRRGGGTPQEEDVRRDGGSDMNVKMIKEANDKVDDLYRLLERIRLTLQLCQVSPHDERQELVGKGIELASVGAVNADSLSRGLHLAVVAINTLSGRETLLQSLNELSKPEAVYDDETIRRVIWEAVDRLREAEEKVTRAEGLVASILNNQETLPEGVRNPVLIEKCKKFLGEK